MTKQINLSQPEYTLDDYLDSIDYKFSPIEELALEVINERLYNELTQSDLAKRMKTKQSVVSRFENLGRSPSLKWLIKIAEALGTRFRATIHGDYMYVVPRKYRTVLDARASVLEKQVVRLLEEELTEYCEEKYQPISWNPIVSTLISEPCEDFAYKSLFLQSNYYEAKPVKAPFIEQEQLVS